MTRPVLALDVGGTNIRAAVVDERGRIGSARRVPTAAASGRDAVLARIVEVAREAFAAADERPRAVGVACVGPLDPKEGVVRAPPNLPGFVDVPLVSILEHALGAPVVLENDANAAALAEHRYGAGRGVDNLVYLTLSTGIGGGVVVGGRLYSGENGNAAEVGHMTVAWNGWPCACGNRGCLEAMCSGTAIARSARRAAEREETSMVQRAGGIERITAEIVVDAAREGDPVAVEVWQEAMQILAAGLANVVQCFNPRRIVLGGGLTRAGDLLFQAVTPVALGRAMRPLASVCEIVPAALGDDTGLLGAAAVAFERADDDGAAR